MAKRLPDNKFVLAAKDMNGFLSDLEKGFFRMSGKAEDYNASVQRKFFGCRKIFLPLLRFNEAGDMLAA